MSTLATVTQQSSGSPSHSNQRRKTNKRNPSLKVAGKHWQEKSLLADEILLHIENPEDATRKWPDFINEFGKVAGYKIDTQKSTPFYILTTKDQKEKLRK